MGFSSSGEQMRTARPGDHVGAWRPGSPSRSLPETLRPVHAHCPRPLPRRPPRAAQGRPWGSLRCAWRRSAWRGRSESGSGARERDGGMERGGKRERRRDASTKQSALGRRVRMCGAEGKGGETEMALPLPLRSPRPLPSSLLIPPLPGTFPEVPLMHLATA